MEKSASLFFSWLFHLKKCVIIPNFINNTFYNITLQIVSTLLQNPPKCKMVICLYNVFFYYSLMYTQCNLDKILNSVTEAVFWCINLPVWLFFHCVKTAFGSQKNLIKRRKKWNFQKLTYYIALNIKYYSSYIYLVLLPTLFISSKEVQLFSSISNQNKLCNQT